jgi:hypothetical protein
MSMSVACGGADVHAWTPPAQRAANDDPAQMRPGYCSSDLHVWWPLTQPELAALHGLDRARAGDPHALLALALVASGTPRDAEKYDEYVRRVDKFVADLTPTIQAANDDWHRGYELHRAMHRTFFTGGGELAGYQFEQSRVAGIFETGHYNCISSAMLFVVLARYFGMSVRGVLVPTHAFVEMGPAGGKTLEIETTSDTGFDLVHDERFYREAAAGWSSQRGLRPVTLDDYQHRQIVDPYRLMAAGMAQQSGRQATAGADRSRLLELAAFTDADDAEWAYDRLSLYITEGNALRATKSAHTLVAMFDCVGPALSDLMARGAKDPKVGQLLAWARAYYADALSTAGRTDEATAIAADALGRIDPAWEDAGKIRDNFYAVLIDRMLDLMNKKQFAEALKLMAPYTEGCSAMPVCAEDLTAVTRNWAVDYINKSVQAERVGDWQAARQALQDCATQVPDEAECKTRLADLESRHRF